MSFNITSVKTASSGLWQGDNPLQYAFPLLIIQTTLVLLISRVLSGLLKPLRQPKVVAEILGGIVLGPSALGRNKEFTKWIFPSWSTPILESVASMGLLFFLFLVGLELDLNAIRTSGRKAFGIALAGISLPFIFGIGVTFLLRKAVKAAGTVGYTQYLMFTGVSLSITAFPVLARILAELKLLTTQVGQTAMAAAAFNDVAAWILLALAVALEGGGAHNGSSSMISIWILLSGIGFVIFMLVVIKPVMQWVAKQCTSGGQGSIVDEACICLTLAAVMLSGFLTDLIGIHSIFGAFVFGLMIPKDGEFAASLIKRIEDFVSGLLLPLYFASSGLKTNVSKIKGLEAWGLLVLVISTACTGKILGTFVVAMLCMTPVRESLTLGVLMNTKGLVELIVLNIGREKKVLDDEMFAILVMMALFTTFMTTPMVLAIHKPVCDISNSIQQCGLPRETTTTKKSGGENLRIMACIRGPGDSPSLINLIESLRSKKNSTMKLYIMQLVEFTDRSSSIMLVQRARRNGVPFIRRFSKGEPSDQIMAAFEAYSQLGRVTVRSTMSISSLSVMHEEICHVAKKKKAEMIILPFHKQWKRNGDGVVEVNLGQGWKGVNESMLTNAPSSIAIFVDRGFGNNPEKDPSEASLVNRVCIVFLGGSDSRKSLEIGSRMAEHPAVRVTVVRFIEYAEVEGNVKDQSSIDMCIEEEGGSDTEPANNRREKEMDEAYLFEFRKRWEGSVEYVEKVASNIGQELLALGQSRTHELIVVGKGRFPPAITAALGDCPAEQADLGPAGDLLASSGWGINCSALVIQAH